MTSFLLPYSLALAFVPSSDNALEAELKAMGLYGVINSTREIATTLSNLALEAIKEEEEKQEEKPES